LKTSKTPTAGKTLTEGQRAYEAKRAAKAGMSLEKWLSSKQRQVEAEAREKQKAVEATKPAKKPGLISRLLDRAHKPL
jgi:peptidyl-tRNA hydrolase